MQTLGEICKHGGDASGTAAIIGGMLGALFGVKALPKYMVEKITGYNCVNNKNG